MRASDLIAAIQAEILRHEMTPFEKDGQPVYGCKSCLKPAPTVPCFLAHIANDAIPKLIRSLSKHPE